MSVQAFSLFFAVLALLALAGVAAVVAGAVVRAASRGRAGMLDDLRIDLGRASLALAWVVATVATLGSLYYSEIADFTPCTLCWYQRICMYPLAVVLGIATFRRDRSVRWYVAPMAAIGAVVASYHSYIQAYPPPSGTAFCTLEAPCTARYVWELGFVSLPFMALAGFAFIVTMMVLARPAPAERDAGDVSVEDGVDVTTERDAGALIETEGGDRTPMRSAP